MMFDIDVQFEHAVSLAVFVAAILFAWMSLGAHKKDARGMITPPVYSTSPFAIPFIGSFVSFAKNPVQTVMNGYKKHGSCFTMKLFGESLTFFVGADAHETYFRQNDEVFDLASVYGFMTPVFGEGIIYDATKKRRAQQLQFMANGLRTMKLKSYVSKIILETQQYFEGWKSEGKASLSHCFSELTILTASRALMGDEVRENLFKEVSELYHDLDGGTSAISFFFPYLPIPAHKKRDEARIKMKELFSKVIHNRRESGQRKEDILQTFMDSKYKDDPSRPIPDDHIVGLLIGLLFAGQHTSSITLSWTVIFLLLNPKCLEKVLEEQNEVLGSGSNQREISFDNLAHMKYLHACIQETLRLRPPLIFLMRRVMSPIQLKNSNISIPKGHIAVASPAVAGTSEEMWGTTVQDYDPNRFLNKSYPSFQFLGFGGGIHGCMGQQYAMLQIKIVLSIFLRQFNVDLCEKRVPEPDYTALVVGPSGECNVTFRRKTCPPF